MQSLKINLSLLFLFIGFNFTYGLDSLNMSLIGQWNIDTLPAQSGIRYNDIWGYTDCSGNEYALLGSARYIHVFDLSTPSQPREVYAHEAGQNSIWRDIKTYRDRAYTVADQGSDGLMIFDLSDLPNSVSLSNQRTDFFSTAHNIYIDEQHGRLYIIGSNSQSNGVIILDIATDPDNPVVLASINLPGNYIHDMYVVDNIGFAASGGNGLWVYDFTDPQNPTTLGSLTNYAGSGYNHSNWATSDLNHLVFADETHGRSLKIADISDLSDISVISQFKSELMAPEQTGSIAHNPFIRGDYCIVSYYHDGVQIFDISNPDSVINVAYYDTNDDHIGYGGFTGNWGVYPFLPSGLIIASDITNGLHVLSADSISFEAISPTLNPSANLSAVGDTNICEGENLLLQLDGNAQEIQWFFEDELIAEDTLSIEVDQNGAYWVYLANNHCTTTTDIVQLIVNPIPIIDTTYEAITFCEEPPVLQAPPGFDLYLWHRDGTLYSESTASSSSIDSSGMYQLEVVLNGCSQLSNSFEVQVGSIPDLSFVLNQTGSICDPWLIQVPQDNQTYSLFKEGEFLSIVEDSFRIEASGIYSLLVENEFCEATSTNYDILIEEPIVPAIFQDQNLLSCSESQAYQWYYNGELIDGATAQNHIAQESGLYFAEVLDYQGCSTQTEEIFVSVTSTYSQLITKIDLFPNPVKGKLQINFNDFYTEIDQIELRSNLGQLLLKQAVNSRQIELDLEEFASGIFFLYFIGAEESLGARKLIKI